SGQAIKSGLTKPSQIAAVKIIRTRCPVVFKTAEGVSIRATCPQKKALPSDFFLFLPQHSSSIGGSCRTKIKLNLKRFAQSAGEQRSQYRQHSTRLVSPIILLQLLCVHRQ